MLLATYPTMLALNPRQLNAKGSILHHVTHASSLSDSWRFSHVGHWPVPILLSNWRSEALAMLSRETGKVVRKALPPPVAFDKGEGVLVFLEVIVTGWHCALLTVTCSSTCCQLSTCLVSSFLHHWNQISVSLSMVYSHTSKNLRLTSRLVRIVGHDDDIQEVLAMSKRRRLRHENHAWVRGATVLRRKYP